MKRIGLLGGSFDPPHLGHLWIATFAHEQLDLESVLLVPASVPPHKSEGTLAPYPFRFGLLQRVASSRPWLTVSDLEADADGPSYTARTLEQVSSSLSSVDELWLLLGSDSMADLPHWHRPEEILRLASLAVYRRGALIVEPPQGARLRWIEGPVCGLSSTLIRHRLRRGLSIDGMVPHEIVAPLLAAGVYRREGEDV